MTDATDGLSPPCREGDTTVWVVSDLQTADPAEVDRYLGTALEDVAALGVPDRVWYLGDAVAGADLGANRRTAARQVELFEEFGVPLRFVMGNHDLDAAKRTGEAVSPFYEAVQSHEDWHTTGDWEEFYFVEDVGEWTVLFLSDHVDGDGRWSVTHGQINGDADAYPHSVEDYRRAIEGVGRANGPAIVAGHNAFPGGNRGAAIQRRFFPLPENVRLHLYGHAHVGDAEHVAPHTYRTISYVHDHPVPQIDVASLEDRRGDTIRSALLSLGPDGECAVHLRDHAAGAWLESYRLYGRV